MCTSQPGVIDPIMLSLCPPCWGHKSGADHRALSCGNVASQQQWQEELSVCDGLVSRTLAGPPNTHTHTHTGNSWRMPSRRADADCTSWTASPLSLGSTLTNVIGDSRALHPCLFWVFMASAHHLLRPESRASNLLHFCLHTDHLSQVCLWPSQAYGSSEEAGPLLQEPCHTEQLGMRNHVSSLDGPKNMMFP